jgi:hypothetical protein
MEGVRGWTLPMQRLRMDVVSIVNGNVCGRFRDMLTQKVLFLQVHNSASLVAK